ncbi:hypothetical protein CMUS01_08486 [Colletotrichum musicola]|uniref:Uncharacterized protein n=1 Tax=Colletotrichum musicola TaxID=2175873 RepID=A0A8H6KCQ1_9PEZI|nr:hypothetical protein CMUS01_08486 [Colletotrichum musicola]
MAQTNDSPNENNLAIGDREKQVPDALVKIYTSHGEIIARGKQHTPRSAADTPQSGQQRQAARLPVLSSPADLPMTFLEPPQGVGQEPDVPSEFSPIPTNYSDNQRESQQATRAANTRALVHTARTLGMAIGRSVINDEKKNIQIVCEDSSEALIPDGAHNRARDEGAGLAAEAVEAVKSPRETTIAQIPHGCAASSSDSQRLLELWW